MTKLDVKQLNDENLAMLLVRGADDTIKESAAFELYKRESRYRNSHDFLPFRQYCIARERNELETKKRA